MKCFLTFHGNHPACHQILPSFCWFPPNLLSNKLLTVIRHVDFILNHLSKAKSVGKFPRLSDNPNPSCGIGPVQQMSKRSSLPPFYRYLMKGCATWWLSFMLLFPHVGIPKTISLSGTNPKHVGIVLFSSTSLSFCPARGSNKLRQLEVFSDQSEQDAKPVVTARLL